MARPGDVERRQHARKLGEDVARSDRRRAASEEDREDVEVGQRPVARRERGGRILEPAVGVHVRSGLLGERCTGDDDVGELGQLRDVRVLDDQVVHALPHSLRLSVADPRVDGVRGDVERLELARLGPRPRGVEVDDRALEVLEHGRHAPAVRALLGVDRERPRDDEAGVARAALRLVGLERLVLADGRHGAHREHVGRVQALDIGRQQIRLFDREERREHAERLAAAAGDFLEPVVDILEDDVDRRGAAGRLEVEGREQGRVVGGLVGVAALVADPVVVDVRVEPRLEPPEGPAVLLGRNVAAGRAAGADRVVLGEEPDALLVEEILVEQSADRAEVDDVTRERVVDGLAGEDIDLGVVAARPDLRARPSG